MAKVLYILDKFPNLTENFILREILALRRLGVDIQVCALNRPALSIAGDAAAPQEVKVFYLDSLPRSKKVCAVFVAAFKRPALFARLLLSAACEFRFSLRFMFQRLKGLLIAAAIAESADFEPDHVHAHFAYVAADVARILAELYACKWSVSAHAWDIFTQPHRIIARRISDTDRIFVCSMFGKNILEDLHQEHLGGRITLMYHGLEPAEFEISGNPGHIIAVGRLEEKKGFDVLLRALKILADQGLRPRCLIVGDGPQLMKLEALIKELKLTTVELTGEKDLGQVKRLMADSIMLVHPGRIAKNLDCDGIPNVILEAMALGRPVVASAVGGIPELIRDGVNGILVEPDNPEALSAAIGKLLADRSLSGRMGNAAKEHVKKSFRISDTVQPIFIYFSAADKDK